MWISYNVGPNFIGVFIKVAEQWLITWMILRVPDLKNPYRTPKWLAACFRKEEEPTDYEVVDWREDMFACCSHGI